MAQEAELINFWLKEDPDAIALVNAFSRVSQIWDDLHDGDKPVSRDQVDYMMMMALLDIPGNRFYQANFHALFPVIQHCLFSWLDANTLEETGDDRDLQVSYIIRSSTTDLIIHVAGLVGGAHWRRQAALAVRRYIYHDNEPFEDYRKEIISARPKEAADDVQQ